MLKQISDVMHKNPTWKLSVSGHTDNIGGDDFNLKLSQARAEAVKTALVNEYKIAPDRLTTSGFGASGALPTTPSSKAARGIGASSCSASNRTSNARPREVGRKFR